MSESKKQTDKGGANKYRIPDSSRWAGTWKLCAGIGVLGLGAAGYGYTVDPERFAFSYLFAFFLSLTIGLGAIFFVLVERLTSAHWSVGMRRTAEFFMGGIPILALLFVPIIIVRGHLFPWLHQGEHAEHAGGEHAALTIIPEAHAQGTHEAVENTDKTAPRAGGGGGHGDGTGHGRGDGSGSGHGDGTGAGKNEGAGTGLHLGPGKGQGNSVGGGHAGGGAEHGAGSGGGHGAGIGGGAHTGQGRPDPLELEEEKLLEEKASYLNQTALFIRAIIYFAVWIGIAWAYFGFSTNQDGTRDPKLTLAAQKWAPVSMILFGLSLTFAAFDWLMSLNPSWFSTIFGVTIFAGSVVAIYATIIIVTMSLREEGILKDALKIEHYHDMGKLMFGFMIFWAYTSFSQFMLIWYAALPEETTYFHMRWDVGPWKSVSWAIIFLHFIIPFFVILSRNAKRRLPILRFGAMILLVMHVVELYWIVLPNYLARHGGEGPVLHWMDAACLLGVGGAYLAVVFNRMTKHPLIPIGDPRLSRSLHHEIENA